MGKTHNLIGILIVVVFFFFGALIGGTLAMFTKLPPSFFDFKLINIFQLVVTIILGCYITYLLMIKSNKELKKIEIYIDILDDMENKIINTTKLGQNFMEDTENMTNQKQELLNWHKQFNSRLSFLKKMSKDDNFLFLSESVEELWSNHIEMKQILTEEIFNEQFEGYSREHIRGYRQQSENILNSIYTIKLNICRN